MARSKGIDPAFDSKDVSEVALLLVRALLFLTARLPGGRRHGDRGAKVYMHGRSFLVSGLEKKGVSRNRIYSTTLSFFDFIDACDSCNSWISRIKPTMIMYGQYVCLEGENICH